jgi:hypothetical protein
MMTIVKTEMSLMHLLKLLSDVGAVEETMLSMGG